jgi:hypothetical protein
MQLFRPFLHDFGTLTRDFSESHFGNGPPRRASLQKMQRQYGRLQIEAVATRQGYGRIDSGKGEEKGGPGLFP